MAQEIETPLDAYSIAIQLIGNALVARKGMVDMPAGQLIDSVFSDAVHALSYLRHSKQAPLFAAAEAIIDEMRGAHIYKGPTAAWG